MKIIIVILLSLALLVVFLIAPFAMRISISKKLAANSEPYQQIGSKNAHKISISKDDSADETSSILFVGDSTGVGTGGTPKTSLAGLVGVSNATLTITNLSRDGARTRDVVRQLNNCQPDQYAIVVIMAGGNDVIRFTSHSLLALEMTSMLIAAKRCAGKVVWIPNGNVGLAPIMPWPMSSILTARARENRILVATVIDQLRQKNLTGIDWVDLYAEKPDDVFSQRPNHYYASDKLHPSAAGYRAWFDEALKQSNALEEILRKDIQHNVIDGALTTAPISSSTDANKD